LGKRTKKWEKSIISFEADIETALAAISNSGAFLACILDKNHKIVGIISDSDIRKALLKGATLKDSVRRWYNSSPKTASESLTHQELREFAISKKVREVPLHDEQGRLTDIYIQGVGDVLIEPTQKGAQIPNSMIILAGGLGTRLRSKISDVPKPLAPVGGKPILETIIMRAALEGISNFFIAVNYMLTKSLSTLTANNMQA
jgi:CBS domain-containing protein